MRQGGRCLPAAARAAKSALRCPLWATGPRIPTSPPLTAVFEKAGVQSGALASAAVGATNVVGTAVAAGLMDKAGRK